MLSFNAVLKSVRSNSSYRAPVSLSFVALLFISQSIAWNASAMSGAAPRSQESPSTTAPSAPVSTPAAQPAATGSASLPSASSNATPARNDKALAAGAITLQVVQCDSAASASENCKDLDATVKVSYDFSAQSQSETFSKSKTFNGSIVIPAQVVVDKETASIGALTILDQSQKVIASFEDGKAASLVLSAKNGVAIRVIITPSQGAAPVVKIIQNHLLPIDAVADTHFRSIKEVFPNPEDILTTQDIEGTWEKLREVSSATYEYHDELVKLVKKCKQIDMAHLKMIANAVYFPLSSFEEMHAAIDSIYKANKQEDRARLEAIEKNRQLANAFSSQLSEILNLGMTKLSDLNIEGGRELLNLAYAQGELADGFNAVLAVAAPLSGDQKLDWMGFALKKAQRDVAVNLASDWYTKDSDRTVKTLLSLASKFNWDAKDQLLAVGLQAQSSLSTSDLLQIVGGAYQAKESLASTGISRLSTITPKDVVLVAGVLSYDAKDHIVEQGLNRIPHLSTDEILSVQSVAYQIKGKLPLEQIDKISDLTVANASKIANSLSWDDKDAFIKAFVKRTASLSSSEVVSLSQACYQYKAGVILDNVSKISDFSAENVVMISKSLNWDDKDTLIKGYLSRPATRVTTAQLLQLADATYQLKSGVRMSYLSQISDLDASNLYLIEQGLNWDDKDTLVLSGLALLKSITPADLTKLAVGGYQNKAKILLAGDRLISTLSNAELYGMIQATNDERVSIAKKYFPKVSDLSVAAIVKDSGLVNWDDKDTLLSSGIDSLKSVSPSELAQIAPASYQQKGALVIKASKLMGPISTSELLAVLQSSSADRLTIVLTCMSKVSDLKPASIVMFSSSLQWDDKDTLIKTYMNLGAKLSTREIEALADAGSQIKNGLILSNLGRINDLTSANAIELANRFQWDDRDTFLLSAVDLITDLTADSLTKLSALAYQQKAEVLARGVRRLAGGH